MIDYSPLWETLKERHVTQYQLLKGGIDNKTLDSLKKGKNVFQKSAAALCVCRVRQLCFLFVELHQFGEERKGENDNT